MGSSSVLSPSSLRCRNTTFFSLLRNQMLIVSSTIPRKIVGEIISAEKQDIVPSLSNVAADKGAVNLN